MQKNEIAGTFCVSDFLRAAEIFLDETGKYMRKRKTSYVRAFWHRMMIRQEFSPALSGEEKRKNSQFCLQEKKESGKDGEYAGVQTFYCLFLRVHRRKKDEQCRVCEG